MTAEPEKHFEAQRVCEAFLAYSSHWVLHDLTQFSQQLAKFTAEKKTLRIEELKLRARSVPPCAWHSPLPLVSRSMR